MSWILITIIAYFLLAVVNLGDKFLLDKVLPGPKIYTFLISILGGLVIVLAPWLLLWPGFSWLAINFLVGIMFPIALWFMFSALKQGDASRITVLIGGIVPVVTIIFSYIFFQERFSPLEWLGIALLIIGTFIMALAFGSADHQKPAANRSAFILSFFSALFYALFFLGSKYIFDHQNFWSSFIWIRIGSALAVLVLLLRQSDRREIISGLKGGTKVQTKAANRFFIFGNQALGALGNILQSYAISLGSVAIVNALQGVQYAFLLAFGWILTIFRPGIIKEDLTRKIIIKKILAIILISLGLYLVTRV
jgi:drug/metabolite transporter (DMT)-like permease